MKKCHSAYRGILKAWLILAFLLFPSLAQAWTSQAKWQGITFNTNNPPDVTGDVGPSYVMEMVNSQWQVWDKSGTPVENGALTTFFRTPSNHALGDPVVLYDPQSGRWFVSVLDCTTGNALLAVSKTNDPRYQSGSNYYLPYTFSVSNNFVDQPRMGTADDKLVLSGSALSGSCFSPGNANGAVYWVITKSDLINGVGSPSSSPLVRTVRKSESN